MGSRIYNMISLRTATVYTPLLFLLEILPEFPIPKSSWKGGIGFKVPSYKQEFRGIVRDFITHQDVYTRYLEWGEMISVVTGKLKVRGRFEANLCPNSGVWFLAPEF